MSKKLCETSGIVHVYIDREELLLKSKILKTITNEWFQYCSTSRDLRPFLHYAQALFVNFAYYGELRSWLRGFFPRALEAASKVNRFLREKRPRHDIINTSIIGNNVREGRNKAAKIRDIKKSWNVQFISFLSGILFQEPLSKSRYTEWLIFFSIMGPLVIVFLVF